MNQSNLYQDIPKTGYLRLRHVLHFIPVSKATWWNWVASGKAPAAIKLGLNTTAWKAEDIRQFLNDLAKGV